MGLKRPMNHCTKCMGNGSIATKQLASQKLEMKHIVYQLKPCAQSSGHRIAPEAVPSSKDKQNQL